MGQLRSIEIDFDVHQLIEIERRSFAEMPNIALRRLLGLDETTGPGEDEPAAPPEVPVSAIGYSWTGKGVMLPHGTETRMPYNGGQHFGEIDNGEWVVEGKRYRSPSAAAGGVAVTKSGKHTMLNGWKYWEVKRPGDDRWIPIDDLRHQVS